MRLNAERTRSTCPTSKPTLNYLAPMTERPRNYTFDPPPGVPRSNSAHEAHIVPIHDARPIEGEISLDREGFALCITTARCRTSGTRTRCARVYYPEAERRAGRGDRRQPACSSSITPYAGGCAVRTIARRRAAAAGDPRACGSHREVGSAARARFLRRRGGGTAAGRVQVINLWRPIRGPLRDAPLAVCDAGRLRRGTWCRPTSFTGIAWGRPMG